MSDRHRTRPLAHSPAALRARRKAAGLSQDELAEAAGCKQSHLSLMEAGKRTARPLLLAGFAKALDCDVADLRPGATVPEPVPGGCK